MFATQIKLVARQTMTVKVGPLRRALKRARINPDGTVRDIYWRMPEGKNRRIHIPNVKYTQLVKELADLPWDHELVVQGQILRFAVTKEDYTSHMGEAWPLGAIGIVSDRALTVREVTEALRQKMDEEYISYAHTQDGTTIRFVRLDESRSGHVRPKDLLQRLEEERAEEQIFFATRQHELAMADLREKITKTPVFFWNRNDLLATSEEIEDEGEALTFCEDLASLANRRAGDLVRVPNPHKASAAIRLAGMASRHAAKLRPFQK